MYVLYIFCGSAKFKAQAKIKVKKQHCILVVGASNLLPVQANACTDLQLPAQTCIDLHLASVTAPVLHLASATAPVCVCVLYLASAPAPVCVCPASCFSYCSCVWMVSLALLRILHFMFSFRLSRFVTLWQTVTNNLNLWIGHCALFVSSKLQRH